MAASYNATKIILKKFTFEIMDVKKCPVRRDGNLVSDGTINDTCVHLPVCYALINGMYIIPAHVTGWGLHPCT